MSEREALAIRIEEWLHERSHTFNAPYGIIASLKSMGKGKVREITFGVARYLDATLTIWSPTKLELHTSRGDWSFTWEQDFYRWGIEEWGAKVNAKD